MSEQHPLCSIALSDIQRQIGVLESTDLASVDFDELKGQVQRLFDGYSCLTRVVDSERAWRARNNHDKAFFSLVSDLWYPPPGTALRYGRLNRPGHPLLYISADFHTATLELRPQLGDRHTILELTLRDKAVWPHVMEIGVVEKASQFGLQTAVHLLEQTPHGRAFLGGNIEKNLAIRSFLAREVTKIVPRGQEHFFKLSAAIGELLLPSDRIDGVEYPSIAGDGKAFGGGTNMALKPSSADRLFVPTACWVAEVVDRAVQPVDGYVVRCVRRAKRLEADGNIVWS